jgi:TolB-like protein/DNA-binding winged helix-turn-helix (wHTH) protein/Flp pilus assembly protein TadD
MGQAHQRPEQLRFGVFEVNLRAGELRKHGLRVRLQEQPFRVLALLLEHSGEVVTREELQKELWLADTFVDFDHGLNKAINKVREALGDSAECPRFVETVARRGYRFLADVKVVEATVGLGSSPTVEMNSRAEEISRVNATLQAAPRGRVVLPLPWKIGAAVAVLVAIILTVRTTVPKKRETSPIRSLAVLPLESLSGDTSQAYFADGMTDELITELGQISALRVISRTSIMPYKTVRKPMPQIARELGVDAVVEGTVLRSGEQVRITAQLIRVPADEHLWAHSYLGDLRDALALQTTVARSIAQEIRVSLSPQEEAALRKSKLVNPEAYEAYLKGRYFWNKRTADGLNKAIQYFNEAIARDPKYAHAYAGLADSYALLGNSDLLNPREAYTKAKAAATRALELDDSLGEAHTSLAFCLGAYEWNWDDAEKEFLRAIAINPGYATAHQWYAMQLRAVGRLDEALTEIKKAESLDPLSLIISADVADVLFAGRRYDEAVQQSQKTIDLDPDFAIAHFEMGQALAQKRTLSTAIEELQKANRLSGGDATCTAVLAYAYAASGRNDEARKTLSELRKMPSGRFSYPADEALIYASLGENDKAITLLEKTYDIHFDAQVLRSPAFDTLRSDPRFLMVLERIGLKM